MSALRIFVSYSHEDRRWIDADDEFCLVPWLAQSLRRDEVEFWYDPELKKLAGELFRPVIEREIAAADVAVLLLSQSFANSEFIHDVELPLIRQRLDAGELVVIPILVGLVDLGAEKHLRWLADRQILPGKPTPLIQYTRDRAAFEAARAEILQALRGRAAQILRRRAGGDAVRDSDGEAQRGAAPASGRESGWRSPARLAGLAGAALAVLLLLWLGQRGCGRAPVEDAAPVASQAAEPPPAAAAPARADSAPAPAAATRGPGVDLSARRERLADALDRRAYDEAEAAAGEILAVDPDDVQAADAQALLDRRAGIGEIGRVDCPSIVVGAAFAGDDRGVVAFSKGIVSEDPQRRRATLVTSSGEAGWAPQVSRLDVNGANAVVFSPDGRTAVAGAIEGILTFDVATGERLATLEAGWVDSLAPLPDGGRVLAAAGSGLELWDLELRIATRRFGESEGRVFTVAASADGRWAASAAENGTLRVWDIRQQRSLWGVQAGSLRLRGMCFSPDARRLLVATPEGLRLLETASGKEVRRFPLRGVVSLAISPDGKWAAAGGDSANSVPVWDLDDGRRLRTYPVGRGSWVGTVAFSADGRHVLASAYGRLHVWALPGS